MAFRRAARVDANHTKMVKELREFGASVLNTHVLKNAFDVLVSYEGYIVCVEIKNPEYVKDKDKYYSSLTKGEKAFYESWGGDLIVATNTEEVIEQLKKGAEIVKRGKQRISCSQDCSCKCIRS